MNVVIFGATGMVGKGVLLPRTRPAVEVSVEIYPEFAIAHKRDVVSAAKLLMSKTFAAKDPLPLFVQVRILKDLDVGC